MITYKKGDVLSATEKGKKIIIHCCNDLGAFGAGVAGAIASKFPIVRRAYFLWKESDYLDVEAIEELVYGDMKFPVYYPSFPKEKKALKFKLGRVQVVEISPTCFIANMIGQQGIGQDDLGRAPIRYDALVECLDRVRNFVIDNKIDYVIGPRFGAGLAQGRWPIIEAIIEEHLCKQGINVSIYDLA